VAADPSRGASLVQRLVAAGYDWLFDRVDPLGGADHRRRLVDQATGEVLEIGAGTGRNLPRYRTATRVVALEPGPGMRARAKQAAQAWQDRLERPWGWLAGGCHPNRDVVAAITAAGFRVVELDRFDFQIMPPLVRPHVLGVAERSIHPASPREDQARSAAQPSPVR
jgi:SAM-dependent methyltransferase